VTTTPTFSPLNPDEACEVCGETRINHGDKQHRFSTDGALIPVQPGPAPRNAPPTSGGQAAILSKDPTTQLVLRLVDRLINNGTLSGDDALYIFGGGYAPDRRTPAERLAGPDQK
jgi:hypothetical protein